MGGGIGLRLRRLPVTDEELLSRVVVAEPPDSPHGAVALARLIDLRRRVLQSCARRKLGPNPYLADEAEDVVQEMALTALRRREDIANRVRGEIDGRPRSADDRRGVAFRVVVGWLHVCLTHICINLKRKHERRQRLAPTVSLDQLRDAAAPEDVALRVEQRETCRRIATELWTNTPDTQRLAFAMRHVHGLSSAETAAALGTSEANVRVLIHRLRASLVERIAESDVPR